MFVLTHGSPANPAQRRVFAILHELGVGPAGRPGVAVLGDGFAQYGPIAGVVLSPNALAVVAAHEVTGADGYLFAPLRGAWSIGGRPAVVGELGANPVHEVDAALKRVVSAIRRGGLDPGSVQALIALDGPISGVAQPETERGQGIVVAPARSDEFVAALDIATRDRSVGLSASWTTADVAGVLQALGFDVSTLDNALLSREGFPYSPYVLRPTSMDDIPFAREEVTSGATRPLRSYAAPTSPTAPPRPDASDDAGALSILDPADSETTALQSGGLLDQGPSRPGASRSRWRWLIPVAALLLVAAGVWFGAAQLFGSGAGSHERSAASGSAAATAKNGVARTQKLGGYTFTLGAHDEQANCAGHAYGKVKDFLVERPCKSMTRALFLTEVDGKPVAVSIAEVEMSDPNDAATLKSLTDTSGTGNVNDLLRDGVQPTGFPNSDVLIDGEYASSVSSSSVRIVEVAFVDAAPSNPNVDAAADAALQLDLSV